MNKIYLYGGISAAIVIIGTFLLLNLGLNINQPYIPQIQPLTITILDTRPSVIYVGNWFTIEASITNLNSDINILKSSLRATTTFDPNMVSTKNGGGSCVMENYSPPLEYGNSTIPIPYAEYCGNTGFVANSAGKIDATVYLQYHIYGRSYTTTASKVFTILPNFPEERGTIQVTKTNSINYTITNTKIQNIFVSESGDVIEFDTNASNNGLLTIQLPKTFDYSVKSVQHTNNFGGSGGIVYNSPLSNRTVSIDVYQGQEKIQIYLSKNP